MGDCIVEEWLRPLNLQHYTQAFLDNGYDDLEVCKQIGEPDLDAIGVLDPDHRGNILNAVCLLREQGGTAVYFTLENPDYAAYGYDCQPPYKTDSEIGLDRKSLSTYPKLQLAFLIRERLVDDDVRLNEEPYCDKSENEVEPESPSHGIYSMISVYGQSPRSVPHPPPSLSSLSCNYVDPIEMEATVQANLCDKAPRPSLTPSASADTSKSGPDVSSFSSESSIKESVGSTLGRLFRNVTLRRSGKKYTYHQHEGDLNASEMMMSEEERIQLMILVKEGKLSINDAVEMVKNHRKERRPLEDVDSNKQEVRDDSVTSLSHTELTKAEMGAFQRDKPRLQFGSPFSNRKWSNSGTKDTEKLGHCIVPLLHRKRSEPAEPTERSKGRSFGWSPPPLPPLPRNSGAIVESMSAECMVHYNGSPLMHSPLIASKSGEIQPAVAVRKSRSLHSSVPPKTVLSSAPGASEENDRMLQLQMHYYENVGSRDNALGVMDHNVSSDRTKTFHTSKRHTLHIGTLKDERHLNTRRNEISRDEDDWVTLRKGDGQENDLNGTLTNEGQKVKALQMEGCYSDKNKKERSGIEQNGHRSRAWQKDFKDAEELVNSSTDSLANNPAPGACVVSSSSSHSSMSTEDEPVHIKLPYISRVRSKVDYIPNSNDDQDALTLKKGDIIHVLGLHDSQLCRGILNNQIGTFRSTDVEPIHDDGMHLITPRHARPGKGRRTQRRPKPKTVEELLTRLRLQHLYSVFIQHGYSTLDDFSEVDEDDLDELNITNPEERVKLLTAAQLLLDTDQLEYDSGSRSASQSPALSHDASSQTILTHFSSRERPSNLIEGHTASHDADQTSCSGGTRCTSETSSDDQEIISITRNGAIMISWGDNNVSSYVSPASAATQQCGGVCLSDSSASSSGGGGEVTRCSRHIADDDSSSPIRSGVWHQSSSSGVPTGANDLVIIRKPSSGRLPREESFNGRRMLLVSEKCRSLSEPSRDNVCSPLRDATLSSGSRKMAVTKTSASSSSSPVHLMNVASSPSVKTAHVRQIATTSSPIHSYNLYQSSKSSEDFSKGSVSATTVASLKDFLIPLGLIAYVNQFAYHGITTVDQLQQLSEIQLHAIGITNESHVQLLAEALETLKFKRRDTFSGRKAVENVLTGVIETQVHPGASEGTSSATVKLWTASRNAVTTDNNHAPAKVRTQRSNVTDRV